MCFKTQATTRKKQSNFKQSNRQNTLLATSSIYNVLSKHNGTANINDGQNYEKETKHNKKKKVNNQIDNIQLSPKVTLSFLG